MNIKKFKLNMQKENIATYSSYYLCSITQNQTSHSSHILYMVINHLQNNLHKKDNKNMYETREKSSSHWFLVIQYFQILDGLLVYQGF